MDAQRDLHRPAAGVGGVAEGERLPRIACATVLGGALWQPGSGRFWLSLAAGGALTALSGVIWLQWRRRRRA